ncbi:DUF6441 family protein [Prosthecomicrobium hirschii]|uniref:DUF6441 family protein n=1 Tax=Prosthecodimorpha hirschii TaxID=665126 RepID=UPI00221FEA10|nr:DUF6441 family protein [Prosthecomicrobium hirschii]MCW1839443.1 DUF6441 family protein [Prosthecomicrobium hirschii]
MRLKAAIVGRLDEAMRREVEGGEKAVGSALQSVALALKADLREQVRSAGLGDRLGRTWRSETYPRRGGSLSGAALVWSKAPKLIRAHDTGPVIRSANGFWLAIPLPAAGKSGLTASGGRQRITPGAWERRTGLRLRFVYRRNGPSLLVVDNARLGRSGLAAANVSRRKGIVSTRLAGRQTVPVFLLVPQVRLRKRLDVESLGRAWAARVPGLIAEAWPQ